MSIVVSPFSLGQGSPSYLCNACSSTEDQSGYNLLPRSLRRICSGVPELFHSSGTPSGTVTFSIANGTASFFVACVDEQSTDVFTLEMVLDPDEYACSIDSACTNHVAGISPNFVANVGHTGEIYASFTHGYRPKYERTRPVSPLSRSMLCGWHASQASQVRFSSSRTLRRTCSGVPELFQFWYIFRDFCAP